MIPLGTNSPQAEVSTQWIKVRDTAIGNIVHKIQTKRNKIQKTTQITRKTSNMGLTKY
jgi:hypothetical protein